MNARLRIVIADDERPARSFLAALLRSFDDVLIVAEAETGKEAVGAIERERPDLALLDLQMPELDGIGVVRMLKKADLPLIAFVTAYDEYAVRAFEVNAVDYLLKPVEKMRLRETLNRAQDRIEHAEIVAEQGMRVTEAIAEYESSARPPYLERIPIRRRDEIIILPVAQIASIVAEGELLHLDCDKRTVHHHLPPQGSGNAPRSRTVHPTRARDAGQHRSDCQGQRDARRHPCRDSWQWTDTPGQPPAIAHLARALPAPLAARSRRVPLIPTKQPLTAVVRRPVEYAGTANTGIVFSAVEHAGTPDRTGPWRQCASTRQRLPRVAPEDEADHISWKLVA